LRDLHRGSDSSLDGQVHGYLQDWRGLKEGRAKSTSRYGYQRDRMIFRYASGKDGDKEGSRSYRRLGERSPGPHPSLSVTLVIGIT
jgi:hypothetical protein